MCVGGVFETTRNAVFRCGACHALYCFVYVCIYGEVQLCFTGGAVKHGYASPACVYVLPCNVLGDANLICGLASGSRPGSCACVPKKKHLGPHEEETMGMATAFALAQGKTLWGGTRTNVCRFRTVLASRISCVPLMPNHKSNSRPLICVCI